MMPPAASTGTLRIGLIALITSGTSTMVETSPQWPPASVPWATRISTPAATWRSACSLEPTSAATGTSCLRAHVDHRFRRHAERIRNQLDRMAERNVEHLERALRIERLRLVVGDVGRRQFDAVFLQEIAGEVAMLRRDPRFQALPGDVLFARGRDVFRDQHVEPVGLAVGVIVDPFQFLLDRLRRVRGRAQHAKAAGAADGRDHVAAMAEGEQRKFYSQHVADRRFHGCRSLWRPFVGRSLLVWIGRAPER